MHTLPQLTPSKLKKKKVSGESTQQAIEEMENDRGKKYRKKERNSSGYAIFCVAKDT